MRGAGCNGAVQRMDSRGTLLRIMRRCLSPCGEARSGDEARPALPAWPQPARPLPARAQPAPPFALTTAADATPTSAATAIAAADLTANLTAEGSARVALAPAVHRAGLL